MSGGIHIEVDASELLGIIKVLRPLFDFEPSDLMSTLGALGESQTRRRISDEKTAPSGEAWPPNLKGTPILAETGQHLLYSIAWTASADEAQWGAGWEYAHVHQYGAVIRPKDAPALAIPMSAFGLGLGAGVAFAKEVTIPARPFVGISADNAQEIVDVVTDFLGIGR